MRKIILIFFAAISLTSCEKMILATAEAITPDPEISFQVNGETFKLTGAKAQTLRIVKVDDENFAITYKGGSVWDTENTLKSAIISLNCGLFDGELKKGCEYIYTAEEMDTCPYFTYTKEEVVESSPESSTIMLKTMWYNASEGWIKITKMNKKKGIISGNFGFTAVCDDPSNGDVIEITKGVFKDIYYEIVDNHISEKENYFD